MQRGIRSYVIRTGRITDAQRRAREQHWPYFGIEFQPQLLDLEHCFGRRAARTLEIGFGNGEHLLERAQCSPERDFLGVEVHEPGIGHLLLAAARAQLPNVRVIAHDAVEVLQHQIAPDTLDEVQLLFPDPWPKKRHHKRRIVQPDFALLVASRLSPEGRFHLATDWTPYAEQMLNVLNDCPLLVNCATDLGFVGPEEVMTRQATRFQRRGERLGHSVHELLYRRR
ncbi:MAG TPA: tRNA (guanosine(46)-N7)-methyltransferase TrmB [Steroidobacteraceae bacterium]|jgi:tRNA (guanine-N7-)-methyltransferase|nr:tRNA (guanosine(46)-N7)-methyltransferase TrmB [Steroidobacteraceae bacterium]